MYYKLGLGGKALWCGAVFMTWVAVTMVCVSVTLHLGMDIGDGFRAALRSAGMGPILSDLFKLFAAIFGFVMVPILTTVTIAKLNKRLKGQKDEPQRKR